MGTVLWLVAVGLACALLIFSTFAVLVGFVGVLSGTHYLQRPRCHHHYLRGAREIVRPSMAARARRSAIRP